MKAFAAIDEWPCVAAAAAIFPNGSVSWYGDRSQSFALASVTKVLTAATVLIGVEEGSVSLDDVIDGRGATLGDLLGHAAGLAPDGSVLDAPGRRRIYSNAGYERAASHLEAATEMAFGDYFQVGLLDPLGMVSTALTGSPAYAGSSSVEDLVSFLVGLRSILATETLAMMTSPYLPELIGVLPGYGRQAPNTWGIGPEIRSNKSPHWTGSTNSPRTWGHFGQAGTFIWTDPDIETSLVVLTDRPFGDWVLERWPSLSDDVRTEVLG